MVEAVTTDFSFQPYWWAAAPPPPPTGQGPRQRYDVAIVGSGFTGTTAALRLARGGRSVAMVDAQRLGAGAARRNAGYVGRVLKKSFPELRAAKGDAAARAVYGELHAAYEGLFALIEAEGIACHAVRCGRFIAATSPGHHACLDAELGETRAALGHDYAMLPPGRQHAEIGSDHYHGGAMVPDSGAIHPGLLHAGLLDRAIAAGVDAFGENPVTKITEEGDGFRLRTAHGELVARHVVMATNGYTTLPDWHRRRVIPFRAFMAATADLPAKVVARLIPNRRTIIDSNTNIDFFRLAPDAPRLLFGGATAESLKDPPQIAERLRRVLGKVFPELAETRLSHVWDGYCAGTFDLMPHMGRRGNLHHAMGYNFAGIAMGTAFGDRTARIILGEEVAPNAFDSGSFPSMPFYTGRPWFLGLAMRYFAWHDRRVAARWAGRARQVSDA